MFNIEKNIPLPEKTKRGRKLKYPYLDMKIGDSFFVPTNDPNRIKLNISSSAITWGQRNLRGFKVKTQIEKDGVRVWRIK